MSNLSEMFPIVGGGGELKQQEFLSSGTFTPSAELLAKGGWVWVYLVGGGGASGQTYATSSVGPNTLGAQGGSGGSQMWFRVKVTGATTVTVGAGGVSSPGGDSSFGTLAKVSGGMAGAYTGSQYQRPVIGATAGQSGGQYGAPGMGGDSRFPSVKSVGSAGPANSGAGGSAPSISTVDDRPASPGGSGYCLVVWEE